MANCDTQLQERAALLNHVSESKVLEAAKDKIANAFCQNEYETKLYVELATALGVNGMCQTDIRSILQAFGKESDLKQFSSERARQILEEALRKVKLFDLADQIQREKMVRQVDRVSDETIVGWDPFPRNANVRKNWTIRFNITLTSQILT